MDINQLIHHAYPMSYLNDMLVDKLIIMIASNDNPDHHITIAKERLQQLPYHQKIIPLIYHISPDYSQRTNSHYHNQAIIWQIQSHHLAQIHQDLKAIEYQCGRIQTVHDKIPLDLDIILVHREHWYKISARFPLKAHELICLGIKNP